MSSQNVIIPNPLNPGDVLTITVAGTPPPPTITSVTVSGPSALQENATAQFSAKVTGTGNFDPSVKWTCSDGTISSSGLFTAPSKVENVMITATSVQDPTKSGQQPCAISNPGNTIQIQASGGDDTQNVQQSMNTAASQGKILQMTTKGGKFQVGPLAIPSNLQLLVDPQVLISDIPGYGVTQCMFNCGSQNVQITATGAFAQMPNSYAQTKKEHDAGQDSEYRHCITVRGASNLTVIGLAISQAGGDGVNINTGSGLNFNGVSTTACFRQGWSITGGISNASVANCSASGNNNSGFDIEPNNAGDSITNLEIDNFASSNNKGGGISFGLYQLRNPAQVSIVCNNFTSTNDDQYGMAFWNGNQGGSVEAPGSVTANNCSVSGSGFGGAYGRRAVGGWRMVFNNLKVANANRNGNDPHYAMNSAIGVGITGGEPGTPGGVDFNNVTLSGGNGAMQMDGAQDSRVSGTYNGQRISYP